MLSKEHLRFQRAKGSIVPRFVDATNKLLVNLTGEMIDVYQNGAIEGLTREELSELTQPLISGHRSMVVAKGINKLLLDRCQFKDPDDGVAENREKVFAAATQLLSRQGALPDLPTYRQLVGELVKRDPDELSENLYADLPIRQPLTGFKEIESGPLLHRYNLAQVQGLLLHAAELTAEISDPDVGKQRQFFRYLKFFQLMARIERPRGGKGSFRITVDGPISVLTNTQKYGLQLAMFLPAIVAMEGWSIEAEIKQKGHRATSLALDHNTVLRSHYNNLDAYRPDEFQAFAAEFKKTTKAWSLSEKTAPIDLGGQNILVPDFTFKHKASKKTIHLELFHRWHKKGLLHRLEGLNGSSRTLLALGVDRAIKKDSRAQGAMNRSPWFQEHGFLYNGFPPVKRVLATLESFLSSSN